MFKSIVVPVDTGDLKIAQMAIRSAGKLANPAEVTLTLVHVVPIMPLMMLDTVPVSFEGEVAEKAKITLADLARTIDLPGGHVLTVVRIGGVYHEVLAIAREQQADLIVVGSHQPSVATYLLGSNASAIVRHAPCSVMVVREEKPTENAEAGEVAVEPGHPFPGVDDAIRAARETGNMH
jgi:nucleotide-binding universal stress UspA family protein